MEPQKELRLSIPLLISLSFHILIVSIFTAADPGTTYRRSGESDRSALGARDIIVNITPDNKRELNRHTLLSDADSTARGRITPERGDTWLNNSTEYRIRGSRSRNQGKASQGPELPHNTAISITPMFGDASIMNPVSAAGSIAGNSEWTKIPDLKGITRKNALFYSNTGEFSFNTAKFKNFEYFRSMKNKIASNWFPPVMANAQFNQRSSPLAGYTPGSVRIMMIPSQEVKLYFSMNRSGTVLDVVITDSMGSYALDDSCIDAIKNSRSFGTVPADIEGEIIIIPFIFGYYVR